MKFPAVLVGLMLLLALSAASPAQPVNNPVLAKAREIEARLGARVGVAVYDTGDGRTWFYRANERFPLTSTFKALACGALLHQVDAGQVKLDDTVPVTSADLVPYAPLLEKLVGQPVSLARLCAAALQVSDNVAGNKVLDRLGGPQGLTAYLRSIGDETTRLDRREPNLNEAAPGDEKDTTTPAAVAATLRALVLGDALSSSSREQLTAWMVADEVGGPLLRAGVPRNWRVADRTGAGDHGARGIIAVLWPPGRAPLVAAIYLADTDATMDQRNAAIAELGAALAADVGAQGTARAEQHGARP